MQDLAHSMPTPADPGADVWEEAAGWSVATTEIDDVASGRTLASLGLMYLKHGDTPRALVLGLTALSLGDNSPRTALLIADALQKNGDSEQVLAVLSRFEANPDALSRDPSQQELQAKDYLKAIALFRTGQLAEARSVLASTLLRPGDAT